MVVTMPRHGSSRRAPTGVSWFATVSFNWEKGPLIFPGRKIIYRISSIHILYKHNWYNPVDQCDNKVEEQIMRSEDDLRDELDLAAGMIAEFSGNPRTWLSWITYLLEQLEKRSMAANPVYQELYGEMLSALQDSIRQRQRGGSW
jgi:hypothetical protein